MIEKFLSNRSFGGHGPDHRKWVLRKAWEDLLPSEPIWRKKAEFDEGSGIVDALSGGLRSMISGPVTRLSSSALYERILRSAYVYLDRILEAAGAWEAGRASAEKSTLGESVRCSSARQQILKGNNLLLDLSGGSAGLQRNGRNFCTPQHPP
jgi:hypothetical protein